MNEELQSKRKHVTTEGEISVKKMVVELVGMAISFHSFAQRPVS